MTQAKFEQGQEVWVLGGYKGAELRETTVDKVGRKYVTAGGRRYDIVSHQEVKDVGAEGYVYLSEQDYYDEVELKKNKGDIRSYFDIWSNRNISLEQTRQILAILKGGSSQ